MLHNIKEATEALNEHELGRGNIDDIINECADANVDVSTKDLWDWATDNHKYVSQAFEEFGLKGCGENTIDGIFLRAQYTYNYELLSEVWEKMQED